MNNELLIIIPAYNEEESIGKFLTYLKESDINEYADTIIINDASTDATAKIVKDLGFKLISHPFNLGYGTALQTGYKYAVTGNYNYIIQMDSDGQHDICNIPRIYNCLRQKNASGNPPDLVIGSRFLKDSKSFAISLKKKIAIHFFRRVIHVASHQKITDPTSGLQGLSRPVFEYYSHFGNFDNNYPDANMIVQMALLGYRIQEIPAVMHRREAGKSMHFGIIEPMLYMCIMLFSTFDVFVRNKWNLLPKPINQEGGKKLEEK